MAVDFQKHVVEMKRRGDALDIILEAIIRHFNAQAGTIHLLKDTSGLLRLAAHRGIPAPVLEKIAAIPVGKGMAGLAASRKEPVQVCNLQTDTSGDVRPGAKATGMEGAVAIPMTAVRGEVVGVLGVAKVNPYDWGASELSSLSELADILARG